MLNDRSSLLALLTTRRSGRPREMIAPGPSRAELETMISIATRVPDHGKLAPWRFVLVEDRPAFATMIAEAYRCECGEPGRLKREANMAFALQAPTLVAAVFRPVRGGKIPVSEQRLSMGAATFALELAASALGYVAGWITGWPAYSRRVTEALGEQEGDEIAGFVFIGSPSRPLEDRERPALETVMRNWPEPAIVAQ